MSLTPASSPVTISRRRILRLGCAGAVLTAAAAAGLLSQTDFLDRIQGVTHTPLLADSSTWSYTAPHLTLALGSIPELAQPGTALRLEAPELPADLLIVHGAADEFYVFVNQCTHGGRKIDLGAGGVLTCSSVGASRYGYDGSVVSGAAIGPLTTYTVERDAHHLRVTLT